MGCGNSKETLASRLPQYATGEEREKRQNEIEKRRPDYDMDYSDWLPPAVKKLPPRDVELSSGKEFVDIFFNMQGKSAALEWNKIEYSLTHPDPNRDPYQMFIDVFPKKSKWCWEGVDREAPEVSKRWFLDKEFGRQRLCGLNPFRIRRWDPAVRSKFPVTDDHIKGIVPENQTLESLHSAGRLYYSDFEVLSGGGIEKLVHQPPEGYWVAPIALFYVSDDEEFMPLAIQLQQANGDSDENPIWTPGNAAPGTWKLVKLFFQQAEASLHESCYHLMGTHMISETFYDCAMRQFSEKHPLYELFHAHFWGTLLINESARKNLFSEKGQLPTYFSQGYLGLQEMIRRMNHSHDFNDWVPSEDFKRRGVDDPKKLPGYYYRDDALLLFRIIEEYLTELVHLIYEDDRAIQNDTELQAWAADFNYKTEYWKNVPTPNGRFENRAQLIRLLSIIIYGVSGRHAAVNNGQYDLMSFVPNCPATLRVPPPTRNQVLTDNEVAYNALAPLDLVRIQIAFFHAVSTPTMPEKRLGQYPKEFLSYNEDAQKIVKGFQDKLEALTKTLRQRNTEIESKGKVPYPYQIPEQVACGVAI